MQQHGHHVRRDVLPNGLVVISELMRNFRSVTLGMWIRTGSRYEPAELKGISHFLEHMVFKGTEHRNVEEIARAVDRVGGMMDAFTTKETACFSAKVLDEHLPTVFDVLADLLLRPLFAEEEIVRERQVVLEEIKMEEDSPETLLNEIFMQNFWHGHPLGSPILGTPSTVASFDRARVTAWFRRSYVPGNIVIAAAGNVQHEHLMELVTREFGGLGASLNGFGVPAPRPHASFITRHKSNLEQVHICIGVPACSMTDERRYAASLLNNILGAGMSSRLFQKIRERQGLAYAIFSEVNPYRDAGVLAVYAGTARNMVERLMRSVLEELDTLKGQPVTEEELQRAKDQLKGSLTLALESTGARMANSARQEIYFGRFFTLEETFASIQAVTREQLQELGQQFFQTEHVALTVLGNLEGFELTRERLAG